MNVWEVLGWACVVDKWMSECLGGTEMGLVVDNLSMIG